MPQRRAHRRDGHSHGRRADSRRLHTSWHPVPDDWRTPHPTGTDRVAERAAFLEADVIVNVQGDEPFISPTAIEAIAAVLLTSTTTHAVANAYTEVDSPAAVIDHNVIKATLRQNGTALAFSRHPSPIRRAHGRPKGCPVSAGHG
ncbi:cytidylyltransferase domain-containing protein [Streptomyces ureilyticus]|uniref:cytidylyltransferase domain-containing protein n=1 Tax=Streptomyces ureilyticus TaxID=1775131 RepID=UPI0038B58EBA